MQKAMKGFSMVELLVATGMVGVGVLATLSLSSLVSKVVTNNSTRLGAQSLRSGVTTVMADPSTCTQNLDKSIPFSPAAANTSGFALKMKLVDGTIVDGTSSTIVPNASNTNYDVQLDGFTFISKNEVNPFLPGVTDPDDPNPNKVYVGDVYLNLQKAGNASSQYVGGTGINGQFIGTLMLTVDNVTNNIFRCYSPDPCTGMGLSSNSINYPACNMCPTPGSVWVGDYPAASGGGPICIGPCPLPGQFLVSNGAGSATCFTPLPPVNGVCGPANGGDYASAAAANAAGICTAGTAAPLTEPGPWSWTCLGLHLGANSPVCSALEGGAINGACGPANGGTFLSSPAVVSAGECTTGLPTAVTDNSPATYTFTWSCNGEFGGTNASCTAAKLANGVCGPANANSYPNAAGVNGAGLCTAGTAAPVSDPGPWSWICSGSGGGSSPSCYANLSTALTNGVCGQANGGNFVSEAAVMATGECSAGNTTAVVQSGSNWKWSCTGLNGGATSSCSATIQLQWPIEFGAGGAATIHNFQQTLDAAGNIYVMGDIDAIFPGGTILGAHGNVDALLAKFSPTGLLLWIEQIGAANNSTSTYGITTDSAGNSIVTGYVENAIPDFSDLLPGANQIGNHTNHDGFIAKFDTNGNIIWLDQIGGAATYDTEIYMPFVDPVTGNIVFSGYTSALGFAGPTIPGATLQGSNGTRDIVVGVLQPNGTLISVTQIGTGGATSSKGSDLVSDGTNIYLTGWTEGILPSMTQIGAHGTNDVYLASINESTLALNWVDQVGIAGDYTGAYTGITVCSNILYNVDFYLNTCTNGIFPTATVVGTAAPPHNALYLKIDHATHALDWATEVLGGGGVLARGDTSPLYLSGSASTVLPASTQIGVHGTNDDSLFDLNTSGTYLAATQFGVPGAVIGGGVGQVNSTNTGVMSGGNTDTYLGGTEFGVQGAYDGYIYAMGVSGSLKINGACGAANGNGYPDIASVTAAGLCANSTTPTAVAGSGPWTWGCNGVNGGSNTAANACKATFSAPKSLVKSCTLNVACGGDCAGWPVGGGVVLSQQVGSPYGAACCAMSPGYAGNGDGKTLWCEDATTGGPWTPHSPPGGAPLPVGSACTITTTPGFPAGGGIIMFTNTMTSAPPNQVCCSIGLGYASPWTPVDGQGWYCESSVATVPVVTAGPTQAGSPCTVSGGPNYPALTGITLYSNAAQRVCCDMGAGYNGTGDGKGMECVNY